VVADSIHASLCGTVPGLNLLRRERIERFMQG
jgi:hypothetical protein